MVRILQTPGRAAAGTRRQLVGDVACSDDAPVYDFLRANGLHAGSVGRVPIPGESAVYAFTVVRSSGGRPLAAREGRVCGRLFEAISPHLGRGLLLTHQPNRHGLPPRTREVLDGLLDGDSEKQVAIRLRLHPATVHDHVKRLYSHFGVNTRAELLAYFLRQHRHRARGGGHAATGVGQ